MGNWDVELDQYKDMNDEMLIEQVIKYFKRSLESSMRAYNNPHIYGEIKDLSEFDIKNLALFEIYAYQRAIAAIEAVECLTEYLNNPNSGENGLVHIDDVRGVMEGYQA